MSKFHLHIVTPKGTYRDVDVDILNIRTTDGQMGILAHHMPLASGVEIAEMNYRIDKDRYEFAVGGGFVYVDGENKGKSFDWNNAYYSGCYYVPKGSYKYIFTLEKSKNSNIDYQRAEIALKKAITRVHVKNNC